MERSVGIVSDIEWPSRKGCCNTDSNYPECSRDQSKTSAQNPTRHITQRTVASILTALETYYVPRKNTTYERYVFRMTIQEVPLRLMDKLKGTLNGREYRRNRRHMHLTQEPPVTILNDHLIDESQAISITPHT